MNIAQRAVRGTVIILFSSYTNMALGIGYGVLMARLLTPEHFGVFAGALFLATLVDIRGKLGLDYALIHKQPSTAELLSTHWLLQMGAALLTLLSAGVAAALVTQFHYPPETAPLILALGGAALVEASGSTARTVLEKELSFGRSTFVVTGSLALSYLAALLVAWQGGAYWALWAQVAVNALFGTLGFWWTYRQFGTPLKLTWRLDPALTRWMLRYGATMTVATLAITILLQFDNFLVLTFVSSAAAGYYVQAYKVAQWPTGLVTHIVARVSLPTYAKLQTDGPRLSKAFELSLWLILTVALPLALAIFVAAPDFLRFLYGDVWLPAALPLRFLIGYAVLRPLLDDTGALFNAIGQPGRITRVLVVQALTLVACATPLTLYAGSTGTAIGVGIAFIVGIGLTYFYVSRTLTLNLVQLFWPPALATVLALGVYWLCAPALNAYDGPLVVRVIAKGAVVTGAFGLIVVMLQYRDIRQRIELVWRIVRPAQPAQADLTPPASSS